MEWLGKTHAFAEKQENTIKSMMQQAKSKSGKCVENSAKGVKLANKTLKDDGMVYCVIFSGCVGAKLYCLQGFAAV